MILGIDFFYFNLKFVVLVNNNFYFNLNFKNFINPLFFNLNLNFLS